MSRGPSLFGSCSRIVGLSRLCVWYCFKHVKVTCLACFTLFDRVWHKRRFTASFSEGNYLVENVHVHVPDKEV